MRSGKLPRRRSEPPGDADVDQTVSIDKVLAPSKDDSRRWSSARGAEIPTYVLDVKPGGKSETANRRKGDSAHRDSHIELVLDQNHTDENQRMIVEITPRFQAAANPQGIDWSTAGLQKDLANSSHRGDNVVERTPGSVGADGDHPAADRA